MRTQTVLLWICLSLVVGLSACDWTSSSPVASLRRATGWPFEVVVVMDRDAWNGEVGELLQEQLRAPIPALPQAEASMRVTYSEPSGFSGLLRYVRNILIVSVDTNRYTKAGTRESPDEWASGQNVVTLYAPTTAALTEFLLLNEGRLVNHFNRVERERWIVGLSKSHSSWINEKLKSISVSRCSCRKICRPIRKRPISFGARITQIGDGLISWYIVFPIRLKRHLPKIIWSLCVIL